MKDTEKLYKDVVYNYDDVECKQTGVGLFPKTPCEERQVDIAYSTWHTPARKWGETTWDIPQIGPYSSDDKVVLRKHAEMLAAADIDFVLIDWSNNTCYNPETMAALRSDFRMIEVAVDAMFEVWATVPNAPKICFLVGPGHSGMPNLDNGNHQKKVDQIYRDYLANEKNREMYYCYDGKPLLICYGATPTQYGADPKWDDDRFTVRWMTGYVGQQRDLFDAETKRSYRYWSWEERDEQTYTVYNGTVESVTCTAASRPQGKPEAPGYIPAYPRNNGSTLKRQFQRAIDLGSRFVLVVSWNEWSKGEQPTPEISKDIEPSEIYGSFYYDLLKEQIKKFKGKI